LNLSTWHKKDKKGAVFFTSVEDIKKTLGGKPEKYVGLSCLYGSVVDFSGHHNRNKFFNETLEASKFLRFSSFFRQASHSLNILGGNYLALHVRTDEREQECNEKAKEADSICFGLGRPYYHMKLSCLKEFVKSVVEENHLAGVYIATPPRNDSLLPFLSSLPFPVMTYEDVRKSFTSIYRDSEIRSQSSSFASKTLKYGIKKPEEHSDPHLETLRRKRSLLEEKVASTSKRTSPKSKGNQKQRNSKRGEKEQDFEPPPFIVSTLEQQICEDSKIFMGSRQSTWTQFVHYRRIAEGRDKGDQFLNYIPCTKKFSVKYFKREGIKKT